MPTYEYACTACNEHVEVVQSFKDDPLTECPACGGHLKKVFAPIGVVFKGSGFYKTDSRASNGRGDRHQKASEGGSSSETSASSGPSEGTGGGGAGGDASGGSTGKVATSTDSSSTSSTSSSSSSGGAAAAS